MGSYQSASLCACGRPACSRAAATAAVVGVVFRLLGLSFVPESVLICVGPVMGPGGLGVLRSIVLAALLTSAVGCDSGEAPSTSSSTTTMTTATTSTSTTATTPSTSTATDAPTQTCSNTEAGYSIDYPAGWSTNAGDVTPPCRYFHPQPFEVPEATEVIGLAVTIDVEEVPFEVVVAPDKLGEQELDREETTVAGRPAVRVETVSTGEALLPEGVRSYQYAVDLGASTLIAVTRDVEGLDYAGNRHILDQMVAGIEVSTG